MVKIGLKVDGRKYSAEAEGHALFNPGNDIVCAAVSCLFYTFAGYLKNRDDVHGKIRFGDGSSEIKAEGDIGEAFEMFRIGLLQIEKAYPENVTVANLPE